MEERLDNSRSAPGRYLDLLESNLLGVTQRRALTPLGTPPGVLRPFIHRLFNRRGWILARWVTPEIAANERGGDWPDIGETMIGRARMRNLRECVEAAIADEVGGDLIETGVWRGGACIYMRGILAAHGVEDRRVWVADSFAGVPAPDPAYPEDAHISLHEWDDFLAIPLEQVKAHFADYGLLDDQVQFLKGRFSDTLPGIADRTWAVVRLDGDLYESTIDGLRSLYPGLSPGGFLIVDDFGNIDACRQAVRDYRREHDISEPIVDIDGAGVYWRKHR